MAKQRTSSEIQVYSSGEEMFGQNAQSLANEIWNSLPEPNLVDAIEELKARGLEMDLHKAVLLVLTRKATERRVAKMREAKYDASEVVRSLNVAIEEHRPDWEEKVA